MTGNDAPIFCSCTHRCEEMTVLSLIFSFMPSLVPFVIDKKIRRRRNMKEEGVRRISMVEEGKKKHGDI